MTAHMNIQTWLTQNPGGNVRTIMKNGMFATNLRLGGQNVVMGPLAPDPNAALNALEGQLGGVVSAAAEMVVEQASDAAPSLATKILGSPKKHISTAAYRVGAKKLVKLVREPLMEQMIALADNDEEKKIVKFISKVLTSQFGAGLIANALAIPVAFLPLPAAVEKVIDRQVLADELRDLGYTEGLEAASDAVIQPMQLLLGAAVQQIVPVLTQGVVGSLPETGADDDD